MSSVVRATTENFSSDSDEDLYTSSIDIRKVRGVVGDCNNLPCVASSSDIAQKESANKPTSDGDDSDSLSLSEPENTFPTKSRESRRKRLKRIEQEKMLASELEEILSDPVVEIVLPIQKTTLSVVPKKSNRQKCPEVFLDEPAPLIRRQDSISVVSKKSSRKKCPEVFLDEPPPLSRKQGSINGDSHGVEVIELEKQVNLFVRFCVDQETGRPGRFMTICQDEAFDSLRPIFAKELKCNELDVLIHVNSVDAGPGDTPDSMGLDINKLALVNVFSLKSTNSVKEDLSNDPNFIAVKCIFADRRPRCAYIGLMEPFSEAKKRIIEQLKLTSIIIKLIFDNEIINDEEIPQSIGMEAEDVIEIHLMP